MFVCVCARDVKKANIKKIQQIIKLNKETYRDLHTKNNNNKMR